MSLIFNQFGFRALWSPYFLTVICLFMIMYFMSITVWRGKFKESSQVPSVKIFFFVIGMLLLYLVQGGPVDLFSHLMFTAHMVQMAVLYLIVPPLLLLGTPEWLMEAVLRKSIVKQIVQVFSRPLVALLLFNGVFSFYHLPIVFDYVKSDVLVHAIYTIVLFFLAVMMWWPIFTPIKAHHTLSPLKKIGYMFGNGVIITPACALIIFANTALYATYTDPAVWVKALELCVPSTEISALGLIGPEMFNLLPPLDDQRMGGTIMKILQEIIYGIVLGYIFAGWMQKERKKDKIDLNDLMAPQHQQAFEK